MVLTNYQPKETILFKFTYIIIGIEWKFWLYYIFSYIML